MKVVFVLVRPTTPDNVGAAARAMKTMGFSELRLVDPCDHLGERARLLAHRSEELLEGAQLFPTLEEALDGVDCVVATTARKRHMHQSSMVGLNELPALLTAKNEGCVAMVFGPEKTGLSNEELDQCDLLTYIPLAKPQPSLNLAQAVMVYAYRLSPVANRLATTSRKTASEGESEFAYTRKRLEAVFENVHIQKESLFQRKVFQRLGKMNRDDYKLFHFFLSKLEQTLEIKKKKG